VKSQVTHLNLDEHRRRMMAMRASQLGISLTDNVAILIARTGAS
jgi:hypothetical protein